MPKEISIASRPCLRRNVTRDCVFAGLGKFIFNATPPQLNHLSPINSSQTVRIHRQDECVLQAECDGMAGASGETGRVLAMAPLQSAMWRDSLLHRDGRNIEQVEIRFREGVDQGRVVSAWRATAMATAALRQRFLFEESEPVGSYLAGTAAEPLVLLDNVPHVWSDWLAKDRTMPLADGGQPWRAVYFPDARTFVWTFHHALLDGRSISRILRAFLERIGGDGDPGPLELATHSPPDSEAIAAAAIFHKAAFEGVEELRLEFPDDPLGAAVKVTRRLGGQIVDALEATASNWKVTVPTLVTWAWGQAIARLSGSGKTAVGQVRAGAPKPGCAGFSMNTVPLPIERFDGGDLGAALQRFRDQWLALRAFESVSPGLLPADTFDPEAGPWPGGVVMVERGSLADQVGGGTVIDAIRLHEYAGEPLLASAWIKPYLDLEVETDGSRFGGQAAQVMIQQWASVLQALCIPACEDPTAIPPEMRQSALRHESGGPPAARLHLTDAWRQAVDVHPGNAAIDRNDGVLSYAELDMLAADLAARLHASGVRHGDRIAGWLVDRSHLAVVLLACSRLGAIHVPLDPALPATRIHDIIEDAGPRWMVTDDTVSASVYQLPVISVEAAEDIHLIDDGFRSGGADDALSLLYTSGSTGRPKGVVMVHGGVCNEALAIAGIAGIGPGDRVLQFASPGFDASLEELLAALLSGATMVPRPPGFPPDFDEFQQFITTRRVSVLDLSTAHWAAWCAWMVAENRGIPDNVRSVIIGGERASAAAIGDWFKAGGRRIRLVNTYGPTEASIVATAEVIDGDWQEDGDPAIGRPLAGVLARVSAGDGKPVANGAAGELWLGGICVGPGYWNRPELTETAFREVDGVRWYRTGDRVFLDAAGKLRFLGRQDDQLKIRGNRIEPNEVIRVLEMFHGVSAAHAGPVTGSDGSLVLAGWIRWEGSPPDGWPAEVAKHAAARLPAAAIPTRWAAVAEFKLTERGKLDRRCLPEPTLTASNRGSSAPAATATEKRLMEIWCEILGLSSIGRDESFFELGGHSLAALRMFSHVAKVWQVRIPMAVLIQAPTPRLLAEIIDREGNTRPPESGEPVVVPVRASGSLPPLFCIHGGDGGVFFYQGLADHLDPERPILAIESPALGIAGEVRPVPVGETASNYIGALREFQPQGPYHLIGYSYGGLLVYEMARQLIAAGESIAFAGLLDTINPAAPIREYSLLERAEVFWEAQAHPDLIERIRRLIGRVSSGLATHFRVKSEIHAARSTRRSDPYSEVRMLQVREAHWESMKAFNPEPLPCGIVLFKSRVANDKFDLPPDYGWTPLVESIEMVEVPGEHLRIFEKQHVGHLAAEVRKRIG